MQHVRRGASLSILLVLGAARLGAECGTVFSIPDSFVLFGNYNELRLIAADRVRVLHPPVNEGYNGGYFAVPSLAARDGTIAWGYAIAWQEEHHSARFALGLLRRDQQWKTYGDFDDIGDAGISPDGSKVAVVVMQQGRLKLLIFDVASERFIEGPYPRGMWTRGTPSWSPDLTRLAVQLHLPDQKSIVAALDVRSGEIRPLGEGFNPQWSPDGQWIAFYSGRDCQLVHPDGTGFRTALHLNDTWTAARSFSWGGPVWSPGGGQLLLNVMKNDGPSLDVLLLDLTTGRTTTKGKNVLPVFGWIRRPAREP